MATVSVYNGFGKYENRDGELGITIPYAGVPFWFPYKRITYLPDWTFREVNHKETAGQDGDTESALTYTSWRCKGERLAEELLDKQQPIANAKKGLLRLVSPKLKGGMPVSVYCGIAEDGELLTAEVFEVIASDLDIAEADRMAQEYKEQIIQQYFASKRERLSGGHGQLVAQGFVKKFMQELNVKDIDALPMQQNGGNSNLENLLTKFLAAIAATNGVDIAGTALGVPSVNAVPPKPVKQGNDIKDLV